MILKGSDARIELSENQEITVFADDEFKMSQVYDLMMGKMTKREIDIRSLTKQKLEKISGDKVKQTRDRAFRYRQRIREKNH